MSKKERVELLVEGGKAVAGPQLGGTLGPLGVNIANIIQEINKKTESFKGMKVPVKVTVDTKTKDFSLEVGTPPVAELIKKELNIEKGSGEPEKNKVGNLAIEQVIKIAKMKQDSMFVNDLKAAVKSVIGSCNSLGILVEGETAKEINEEIKKGKFDKEIKEERAEVSKEKQKLMKEELAEVQEELKKEQEKLAALEAKEKVVVEAPTEAVEKKEEKAEETKEEVKKEVKKEEKPSKEKK